VDALDDVDADDDVDAELDVETLEKMFFIVQHYNVEAFLRVCSI